MRLFIVVLVLLNLLYFFLPRQPAPDPAAPPVAHPGVPRLVLLSEVEAPGAQGVGEKAAGEAAQQPEAATAPVASAPDQAQEESGTALDAPPRLCRTVGPFYSEKELARARELLRPLAERLAVRVKTRQRIRDYQVYIPPLPSAGAARKMVAKLRRDGVKDVYVYRRGEFRNAISLGVYKMKAGADKRAAQLRRKGYAVEIRPRTEQMSIYWVDVESGQPVDWTAVLRRHLRTGAGGVDDLPRDCS